MMIYRPHKGSLSQSLAEAKEFETEYDMKKYIVRAWNNFTNGDGAQSSLKLFNFDDIVIDENPIDDDRTGWKNTRYVCIKRMGNENYMEKYGCLQCIGMCATIYL